MIKYDSNSKTWSASAHLRIPTLGSSRSLRRDNLKSEKEALNVHFKLKDALENRAKAASRPKWPQAIQEYELELSGRDMSEKTKRTYVGCLRSAVGDDWNDVYICDITSVEIKRIIKFKNKGHSESHRKSVRKFFNSFFEFMVLKGYVLSNPTPKLKFKIGQRIETTLNYTQCTKLLDLAKQQKHEFYPVWMLALNTGMRSGELYALKWKFVDIEKRQIKVAGSWHPLDGYKDYTKSGYDRIVPMNDQLVEFLRSLTAGSSPEDFVLPRIKRWALGEQSKVLRTFLKCNNLPEIRFHDLRATCATLLMTKNVPLVVVMIIMGWRHLKTANLYFRKSAVDLMDATQCLDFQNGVE